jgi:hypothetical protein
VAALVTVFGQQIKNAWRCTVCEFWLLHGFKMEQERGRRAFNSVEDVEAIEAKLKDMECMK